MFSSNYGYGFRYSNNVWRRMKITFDTSEGQERDKNNLLVIKSRYLIF